MDEEYWLDDDDQESGYYLTPTDSSDDDSDSDGDNSEDGISYTVDDSRSEKVKLTTNKDGSSEEYGTLFTSLDAKLLQGYDDIVKAGKDPKGFQLSDALTGLVAANPKHTNSFIISKIVANLAFHNGKNRYVSTVYSPKEPMTGEDLEDELDTDWDTSFNRKFSEEARETMTRFVDFLANRDLENDSPLSRRYKQMDIPALIIYLFTNNMYSLIMNCPTMPEYYAKQVEQAFENLMKSKYVIVEQLANKYDEVGRPALAEKVRTMKFEWFDKEPADLRIRKEFSDLGITYDDIQIYREYRNKFLNVSKSITQEAISDMIEVKMDNGVYKKLKDKTRFLAIARVKELYKNWAKENNTNPEVVKGVVFK